MPLCPKKDIGKPICSAAGSLLNVTSMGYTPALLDERSTKQRPSSNTSSVPSAF
jgi:hypothetical protein